MFVSKKVVYLQVQKTGSTHVTKVLKQICGGKTSLKHDQMRDPAAFPGKRIVTSVRNPWDWYVSLWAFGCRGGGGLRKYLLNVPWSEIRTAARSRHMPSLAASLGRLVTQVGRRPDWAELYSDAANEANFRAWLKLILGEEGLHMAKEGYSADPIKQVAGFMTYRFLALATAYPAWMAEGRFVTSHEALVDFADRNMVARDVMRTETLNTDLARLLNDLGHDVTLEDLEAIEKTNTSTHRKYEDYYDAETTALVAARDRFVIERFGYGRFADKRD